MSSQKNAHQNEPEQPAEAPKESRVARPGQPATRAAEVTGPPSGQIRGFPIKAGDERPALILLSIEDVTLA